MCNAHYISGTGTLLLTIVKIIVVFHCLYSQKLIIKLNSLQLVSFLSYYLLLLLRVLKEELTTYGCTWEYIMRDVQRWAGHHYGRSDSPGSSDHSMFHGRWKTFLANAWLKRPEVIQLASNRFGLVIQPL